MSKRNFRIINESQLKNIVSKSIERVLNEISYPQLSWDNAFPHELIQQLDDVLSKYGYEQTCYFLEKWMKNHDNGIEKEYEIEKDGNIVFTVGGKSFKLDSVENCPYETEVVDLYHQIGKNKGSKIMPTAKMYEKFAESNPKMFDKLMEYVNKPIVTSTFRYDEEQYIELKGRKQTHDNDEWLNICIDGFVVIERNNNNLYGKGIRSLVKGKYVEIDEFYSRQDKGCLSNDWKVPIFKIENN